MLCTTYHLTRTAYCLPLTTYFLLLTSYYLLLTTYYLLLTTYYVLLTTYYLLLTTYSYCLLLTTYYLLLTTGYLLLTTYYLLLTTYYLLLVTYCLLLTIGEKGCWTCPLESLPDAIALYEHMGRTPDAPLKTRAKQISDANSGGSAADAIKLAVQLVEVHTAVDGTTIIGRAICTFQYDTDVISSIKQLAPVQRSYNAQTKEWPVDLLALPELLSHLAPLGYAPSTRLAELATVCERVEHLLYPGPPCPTASPSEELSDEALRSIDVDAIVESSSSQGRPCESELGQDNSRTGSKAHSSAAPQASGTPPPPSVHPSAAEVAREKELEASLGQLQRLVRLEAEGGATFGRSDCGAAKRRKLTAQQKRQGRADDRAEDYDDNSDDDIDLSWVNGFYRRASPFAKQDSAAPPTGCDCGQPWRRVGGRHVCRFFGYFQCDCGSRWTSAYTWKGEQQACRSCNWESAPNRTEKLDGRIAKGNGKPHDTSHCSMCAQLGYDCSM